MEVPVGPPLARTVDHVEDLLARLRLDRAARRRGAVVVEGPSDETVLTRAFGIDVRAVFPVAGRTNVLRVAESLHAKPLKGIVCVADRDFDPPDEALVGSQVLVLYDDADLEAMIIWTEVLDRFLQEWGSAVKLAAVGGTDGVRKRVVETLTPVSVLRAANAAEGWGLGFDALALTDMIDKQTLALSVSRVVARLTAAVGELRSHVDAAVAGDPPTCSDTGRVLVRGGDAVAVIEVALRSVVGSLNKQQVSNDFVPKTLRRMVGKDDLAATRFATRFAESRMALKLA